MTFKIIVGICKILKVLLQWSRSHWLWCYKNRNMSTTTPKKEILQRLWLAEDSNVTYFFRHGDGYNCVQDLGNNEAGLRPHNQPPNAVIQAIFYVRQHVPDCTSRRYGNIINAVCSAACALAAQPHFAPLQPCTLWYLQQLNASGLHYQQAEKILVLDKRNGRDKLKLLEFGWDIYMN